MPDKSKGNDIKYLETTFEVLRKLIFTIFKLRPMVTSKIVSEATN